MIIVNGQRSIGDLHYGLRYLSVLENVDAAILMASQIHGIAFRVEEDVVEFADFKFFNDFWIFAKEVYVVRIREQGKMAVII